MPSGVWCHVFVSYVLIRYIAANVVRRGFDWICLVRADDVLPLPRPERCDDFTDGLTSAVV